MTKSLNHIHETACVDEGAVLGANTRVWHFSHVYAGARIGDDCSLGQNCMVADGVARKLMVC